MEEKGGVEWGKGWGRVGKKGKGRLEEKGGVEWGKGWGRVGKRVG